MAGAASRGPAPRRSLRIVWLAAIVGFASCGLVGALGGVREPVIHDEFSYLLAADTFAQGRLANPPHPLWQHFETFHVLQQPSYASKYPPGQGLLLALGQRAGHPILGVWLGVALLCGASVWMLSGFFQGRILWLAAALVWIQFAGANYWAQTYWGGALAATGSCLLWGGARRFEERGGVGDAVAFALGAWALVLTRPLEGIFTAWVPATLLCVAAWRAADRKARVRRLVGVGAPALAALVLGVGVYNASVTGNPLRPAYVEHAAQYATVPLLSFGSVRAAPTYHHDEIRRFELEYVTSWLDADGTVAVEQRAARKLRRVWAFFCGPPGWILLFALPCVLRERWNRYALVGTASVLGATVLLATFGGHAHHAAPLYAPVLLLQIACFERIGRLRPRRWPLGPVVVGLLLIGTLDRGAAQWARHRQPPGHWSVERARLIANLTDRPGRDLVIVRYGPRHNIHREWVYNRADLAQAEVVFARSMGRDADARLAAAFPGRRLWRLQLDGGGAPPRLEALARERRAGLPPESAGPP